MQLSISAFTVEQFSELFFGLRCLMGKKFSIQKYNEAQKPVGAILTLKEVGY